MSISKGIRLMNKPIANPQTGPFNAPGDEIDVDGSTSWTSEEILQGKREAVIEHGGETYRLRLTRNNKLILHK